MTGSNSTHTKVDVDNKEKIKPRRYKVGDPDFIPPDGGWGWLIIVACGFSNLSTFPMFQQFGLIFREKFEVLGFSNAQITSLVNITSAFNSCVGLSNGPVFRRFTFRQVAFFGACLVTISLFTSTYCSSFWTYMIFYSACYGAGIGITQSANALALNTYFKKRRRIATGLSWTTTALGPIVWPYIITALMEVYGMEGTLMIFAGFAGHAILCSLLLQPVEWHTKFRPENGNVEEKPLTTGYFQGKTSANHSLFSSQYLRNEDDPTNTGYEIIDPGTPRLVGANDGWYSQSRSLVGSRVSLSSYKDRSYRGSRMPSGQNSVVASCRPSYANLSDARSKKSSSQDVKERKVRKISQTKPTIEESVAEDHPSEKAAHDLKEEERRLLNELSVPSSYPDEKLVLKTAAKKLAEYQHTKDAEAEAQELMRELEKREEEDEEQISFLRKVVIFFDFDLLNDRTYLNLMLGITMANFVEINFSILTPFVLQEFQFEKYQIASFMSLLGATDICVRFFIPFIAEKIGWQNKSFFLFGVLLMALGRIILVHTRTYNVSLAVAVLIGFGKGLRTIFIALVIPTYVPLERLPAASGLQLAAIGLSFLIFAPVVGWIRDAANNYIVTLHVLNIFTYACAISWITEDVLVARRERREKRNAIK